MEETTDSSDLYNSDFADVLSGDKPMLAQLQEHFNALSQTYFRERSVVPSLRSVNKNN